MNNGSNRYTGQNSTSPSAPRRELTDEEKRRIAARRAAERARAEQSTNPQTRPARPQQNQPVRGQQIPQQSNVRRANTSGILEKSMMISQEEQQLADQQLLRQSQPGADSSVSPERRRQTTVTYTSKRKTRHRSHINTGLTLFIILILAVIGISVYAIISRKNPETVDQPHNYAEIAENENFIKSLDVSETEVPVNTGEKSEPVISEYTEDIEKETETVPEEVQTEYNLNLFDAATIDNSYISVGNLVLVNYAHPYNGDSLPLTNIYASRTGKLKVSSTEIGMNNTAFVALERLVADLEEDTGCDDLIIVSGHRTISDQQRIYDSYLETNGQEYVDQYVANPGYSEHHTGLACDLSFFTDDGSSVSIENHEFGWWLSSNCIHEGYILRYPGDKSEITKISYEPWHFRYVGLPHAYAVSALRICFEEYIDLLRDYTTDTKLLWVKSDTSVSDVAVTDEFPTSEGWLIYFVPASDGDTTTIKTPRGDAYSSFEVSGNNVDGFIVTVKIN